MDEAEGQEIEHC